MFEPAVKEKKSTLIIRQIRSAILDGKFQAGDMLPPENELINQFGVSKHTLREALRALEGMGLITIKRGAGGGPVVSPIDVKIARKNFANFLHFQDVSLNNLLEARVIIEPYIARKAAENFTPDLIKGLIEIHKECENVFSKEESLLGAQAEIDFHVYLGKNSGNPALWAVLDFLNNILAEAKVELQPGRDFSQRVLDAHEKILDAIINKDGEAAEKFMLDHIMEVGSDLDLLSEEAEKTRTQA